MYRCSHSYSLNQSNQNYSYILYGHIFIHTYIYLDTYIYLYTDIHPSIHPSIRLSIYRSIHPSIYLSIYIYIYTHTYIITLSHAISIDLRPRWAPSRTSTWHWSSNRPTPWPCGAAGKRNDNRAMSWVPWEIWALGHGNGDGGGWWGMVGMVGDGFEWWFHWNMMWRCVFLHLLTWKTLWVLLVGGWCGGWGCCCWELGKVGYDN